MNRINLYLGIAELKSNKLRTFLTMLGVIFGIAAVVSMLAISDGAKKEIIDHIELLGLNNIFVQSKPVTQHKVNKRLGYTPGLNMTDATSIKSIVTSISKIAPIRKMNIGILKQSELISKTVVGTTPDYFAVFDLEIAHGRLFNTTDLRTHSNLCVLGYDVNKELLGYSNTLNRKVKINNQWFIVIGILKKKNTFKVKSEIAEVQNYDNQIIIPISTMIKKLQDKSDTHSNAQNRFFSEKASFVNKTRSQLTQLDQISIKIQKDRSIIESANIINRVLKRRHNEIDDYTLVIPEKLLIQKQKTQRIFTIVMGAIAAISLLVGGIGIMNIMLTNVLERTREIGIRRAVGAQKIDIKYQFLSEAIVICALGGILGIMLGYLLSYLITFFADWLTIISPSAIIISFTISFITGIIFGTYPAIIAAEKDPIESLRND